MSKPANTDGRYPHYLSRLDQTEGPARILTVDVIGEVSGRRGNITELVERFDSWDCVDMTRKDGVLQCTRTAGSHDVNGFWSLAAECCEHVGVTWIVSYQCTRIWALMEMWSRLEQGSIRVSGGDYRVISGNNAGRKQVSPGLLIAEDPPCIVQLRVGTRPGSIMWIDCRNWGIELTGMRDRGAATCYELAALVMRIERACKEAKLSAISATAAGQAYRSWRTNHLTHATHCHVNPNVVQLEMDGHIGGRCECFRLGKIAGPVYHLDIRSCYGHVMQQCTLPLRLVDFASSCPAEWLRDSQSGLALLSRVTLRTRENAYPCRRENDTIWPTGTFATTLAGPEIADSIRHGRAVAFGPTARYALDYGLRSFSESVYAIREKADADGDEQISSWAKYVLNSIVGKAAQKIKRWEVVPLARAPDPWGEWNYLDDNGVLQRWRALAGVVQVEKQGGYGPDTVPAISAWICSYGRMMLLDMIRCAGWDQTYYVDTDCLLCSELGAERLCSGGYVGYRELGKLEIRGTTDKCEIRGIKYYLEGDEVRCAGTQRGICVSSPDGLGQWVIPQGSAGAKLHGAQGKKRRLISWPKPGKYRHGVVMADGKVEPFDLRE